MNNVRKLVSVALLAGLAACAGEATAPEAAQRPSRPLLQAVSSDSVAVAGEEAREPTADDSGLIWSGGGR